MTQNQIAYHNARELERHNLASEAEQARHQRQDEMIRKRSNELSHESNIISKEHYERMDAINATHYANQDAYNSAMLAETQRSNLASEEIRARQNAINAAAIQETMRHQLTMEGIESSLAANTIRKTQAEVSAMSPNADYTRAKTQQAWAEWQRTAAQAQLTGTQATYYPRQTLTEIGLKKQQTETQRSQEFVNWMHGISTTYDMVAKWLTQLGVAIR